MQFLPTFAATAGKTAKTASFMASSSKAAQIAASASPGLFSSLSTAMPTLMTGSGLALSGIGTIQGLNAADRIAREQQMASALQAEREAIQASRQMEEIEESMRRAQASQKILAETSGVVASSGTPALAQIEAMNQGNRAIARLTEAAGLNQRARKLRGRRIASDRSARRADTLLRGAWNALGVLNTRYGGKP